MIWLKYLGRTRNRDAAWKLPPAPIHPPWKKLHAAVTKHCSLLPNNRLKGIIK
jgi:hypothetical protein